MSDIDYLEGARACQVFYKSKQFAGFTRPIHAEDAAKLFLPPITEYLTQVTSPLPKPRKDWIKGFREEQINILEHDNKPLDKTPES